ncbi:stereocilin [Colossoma macropomum]|uniref:stereocilin n=1 Tax=Colossoma macropomum TaxID=42526 RepID=UPI00186408E0|nr:stereocilin [Colossoma macropomum]
MKRRGYLFIFTACTVLGLASSEPRVPNRSARSAPTTITRRNEATSSTGEFEEEVDVLIEKILSLKSAEPQEQEEMSVKTGPHSDLHPSQSKQTSRTGPSSRAATNVNLNTYLNMLSGLYSIYEPVLVESFLQNLPQALVCVLADRTQCGWQADLTTTLSSRLSGPVLSLLSSLKSQTCPSTSSSSPRMADSTLTQLSAFQELVTAALSSNLPLYLSDNFLLAWNSFIDLTLPPVASFISEFMVNFLQTFVEFLTVGLQIGVDIPSLDQTQQCQQGDLKQLLMWGLNHNLSWSFGDSILNMFLALDTTPCGYTDTECQNTQTLQLGRSSTSPVDNPTTLLTCDQQDVTHLNDTFCADILANASQVPDALYSVCKALSTLSHSELILVWKNTCQVVQLVLSPLLEPCPPLPSESSQRVARSTLSLSQLFCNYENWTTVEAIDPGLVTMCSDNDPEAFLQDLLPHVCLYSDWSQPTIVDMTDLALCADLDTVNFTKKVCNNTTVLQNLLANLDNTWLLEQCSNLTGSSSGGAGGGKGSLMGFVPSVECQYSIWVVRLPDAALLALCWDYDQANFISSICNNPAVLSHIIQEPSSLWVSTLCTTYSNYTKITTQSNNTNSGTYNYTNSTSGAHPCLVKELIDRLNWSCSVDVNVACQAGISQFQGLQLFIRCGVEVLLPRLQKTVNPQVASIVRQATSVWVVLLLVLEENEMTTLRVTDYIRQNVMDSVSAFLERETKFDNKQVLLQCFGKVLTGLMQTGRDVYSNGSFLIKEYFHIPLASLKAVFSSLDVSTIRQILQYVTRDQANLQLTDEYLHTMVKVLIQVHLRQDETLFIDLSPLLSLATPEDISSLPPLQNNVNVLNVINSIINSLSLEQRQAFGWWFSQSVGKANMTAGGLSFIRDIGNLIAYLPFHSFQYLTPAQLLDGLDVLLRNELGPLKQQFIAQRIIGGYKNLTTDQFRRLATLTCWANQNDLLAYMGTDASPVIQENIRTCVAQGISVPSSMISSLFLNSSDVQSPTSLSPQRISQLAQFLPLMGLDFLQQLSQTQLLPVLSLLTSVPFTPLQAAVIIDKVSPSLKLSESGSGVSKLMFLASGVSVETLWGLPSDALLTALSNFSQYTPQLTPPQANAISAKLWGVSAVVTWLKEVDPLLSSTQLLSVMPRAHLLLTNGSGPYTRSWNTQQAKTLFNEAMTSIRSLSTVQFTSLGTVAQGVSCKVLTKLIQNNPSVSSMSDVLGVLRKQPVPLHPSLKKCLIEELYKLAFFSDLLGAMGAQIALSIPMSTIKKFSVLMTDILRSMIVQDPQHFLLMPTTKQTILVDKIVQRLGMHTGEYTEEEFRSLGIMATFVVDEVFMQLDRSFFVDSVEFLRGFCYDSSKRDIVASMLQERSTFGPVQNWTTATLNQVDRFLFYLSRETIQLIPPDLMSQERIERLFVSQRQWESGDVGSLCVQERSVLFTKQQFVLQYFLGFLKPGRTVSPVPTCESLHQTQPSAWPITSLTEMPSSSFRRCLELIGQDPFFSSFHLSVLLRRTKEVYGAVSSFNPYVTAELGNIATQLTADELASVKLSDIRTLSPLGAVNSWTKKQMGVLFSVVLNSTKQTPSQLDSSSFVALGYIICGIDVAVIRSLNPVEFSKAALWLGRLNLSCSEDQLQAMITLLSHSLAFGSVSSWGPEVFIEIGAFAGIGLLSLNSEPVVSRKALKNYNVLY